MSSVVLEALLRNEESVMRHVAHLHVFLHQVMEKSIHHAMRLIKRSCLNSGLPATTSDASCGMTYVLVRLSLLYS